MLKEHTLIVREFSSIYIFVKSHIKESWNLQDGQYGYFMHVIAKLLLHVWVAVL